jgi:DNA primase
MARIPQDELERLKREVSVRGLAEARGVKLAPHGDNLIGLCPFHDDKDPSLVISPKKNLWNCLGACGKGGSVVDWVMAAEGVSFRHAVEILRADNPELTGEPAPPPKRSTVPKLPLPIDPQSTDSELLTQVAEYYHETLEQSPEALGYLASRGLDVADVAARFKLGFANRTLGYRLPQKNRKDGQEIRARLQEIGVIRESGHEHLNGSLVVPICDAAGQVVQLYGRKITPNLRSGTPRHLYLPGPRRGLFNLEALRQSKEIILCEALIDALTFIASGYENATAAYGTNGFTDELLQAMKSCGTERVLLAFDRDDAGDQAAEKLAKKLGAEGISCFRVLFPRGMDANEYALKVTPAPQSLGVLLRCAVHLAGPVVPLGTQSPHNPANHSTIKGPSALSSLAAASELSSPVKTQEKPGPPKGASPKDAAPASSVEAELSDHEVVIRLGDRRWRVRGLARNLSYETLKVNLLVAAGEHFHVDSLELYSSRQRRSFVKQAVAELQVKSEILSKDLGKVLMKLEEIQAERISKALEPEDAAPKMTADERDAAMALLKDPRLLERVNEDLEACGLVGEETNKLVAYLATVSRKLAKPLGVMVQSSSAAGKSALMDAVLSFAPPEDLVQYSAMTGQSLFYMGETDLQHKVLAIAEEEGADRASYALKLLQSEGKLSIASTGKDPSSGRLTTHEYTVEGPSAILLTTTAIDVDEELLNRMVVLTVDESREQTEAIHRSQREDRTFEGLKRKLARQSRRAVHRNAQRLLAPLFVVNPYSLQLTFLANSTRTRRDHLKYHGLIEAIALLRQHQREVRSGVVEGRRVDYVEVELDDIATANRLASEVLGRTLDELPPQTRRLLFSVEEMVAGIAEEKGIERKHVRFTRRDVREYSGWGNTQLKIHLHRLEEMEYVLVLRGGRGQQMVYELAYDGEGKAGERFVLGLVDVEKLQTGKVNGYDVNRSGSDGKWSGQKKNRSGSSRPQVGGVSGAGRDGSSDDTNQDRAEIEVISPKTPHLEVEKVRPVVAQAASYRPAAGRE